MNEDRSEHYRVNLTVTELQYDILKHAFKEYEPTKSETEMYLLMKRWMR